MSLYAAQQDRPLTILVATSGDTGSAVANGFLGVAGTRVVVLYPKEKVSEIQEKQFTTLGQNINAIEVRGTFDDCQRLVKEAFVDSDCRAKLFMTSANSINVGRLIPQMFYYFRAVAQLPLTNEATHIAVPSGNFGNLTAGLMAKKMGLPVKRFLAATNINDVVPQYLNNGVFVPRPSRSTISNAMDVGNPSNFVRMIELYGGDVAAIREDVKGYAFTDTQTKEALSNVFVNSNYLMDPHGAIGYLALEQHIGQDDFGVFLETAHPGKFWQEVERIIQHEVDLPSRLRSFLSGEKKSVEIDPTLNSLKNILLA
jgi:threonine synthase